VFILARMREEYDRTGSTSQAAVRGIASTGRLVTSAALVLFLSFVAMATGPETDIKICATRLGAGILLDATIVRALLVPALVSLFGRWNWWLPARPARLLRVTPSLPNRSPSQRLPAGTERIAAVHGASGDPVRRASRSCRGCLQPRLLVCLKDPPEEAKRRVTAKARSTPKQV
jgi:RND superfamily putative drug exporter